jgi:hypothetical protein
MITERKYQNQYYSHPVTLLSPIGFLKIHVDIYGYATPPALLKDQSWPKPRSNKSLPNAP